MTLKPKANPAGTEDGGIPFLCDAGRSWPAASDPQR
jgi:hypothetical protein